MLVASTALLAACADSARLTAPVPGDKPLAFINGLPVSAVKICKTAEKAGTYTFNVTKSGGGLGHYPMPSTVSITLTSDNSDGCTDFFNAYDQSSWLTPATFTVTENVPSGMTALVATSLNNAMGPQTEGSSGSVTVGYADNGSVEFTNVLTPPPAKPQGCNFSYWTDAEHFDSWAGTGVTPTTTMGTVFSGLAQYPLGGRIAANSTMLAGLQLRVGGFFIGAPPLLMRAGVSGLLNASNPNVNYAYTPNQVVAMVNNALGSGRRIVVLVTAIKLGVANNRGCPLT